MHLQYARLCPTSYTHQDRLNTTKFYKFNLAPLTVLVTGPLYERSEVPPIFCLNNRYNFPAVATRYAILGWVSNL